MVLRVGQGYDIHPLITGRQLIIGGVSIPFEKGLSGHSDADVLLHAIIDSLLGAAGLGDIGRFFPDNDPTWLNVDSRQLLRTTNHAIRNKGFEIVNIDTTIILEAPKLAIYIDAMRQNIALDLKIDIQSINIKAKTNEKFGYLGKGEAVVAQSTVLCELLSPHVLQEK